MAIDGIVLSEEEVRELREGEVTVINSGGSEVAIPVGMTAWDVVQMLELRGNVEYVQDNATLEISMVSVGTKG